MRFSDTSTDDAGIHLGPSLNDRVQQKKVDIRVAHYAAAFIADRAHCLLVDQQGGCAAAAKARTELVIHLPVSGTRQKSKGRAQRGGRVGR